MSVRIVAIGDLHGKFPEIGFKEFDYIISVGDFTPNLSRDLMFQDLRKKMEDPNYKGNWWDPIGIKEAKKRNKAELEKGREVLERLASYGKPVIAVPGNTDFLDPDVGSSGQNHFSRFMTKGLNVTDAHMNVIETPFFTVIGYGETGGPEVPVDEVTKKRYGTAASNEMEKDLRWLEKRYDRMFKKALKLPNPIILLGHNVPYNTKLDKIKNRDSPRFGQHFGSILLKRLIEKHQPLLSLGGHMHNSKGACYIGDTLCINLGDGPKANIYFEIHGSGLKNLKK